MGTDQSEDHHHSESVSDAGPSLTTASASGETETFDRAAIAADLRELVAAIESIHPEPYDGYDGKVALHEALETTVRDLPETASREACFRYAAPLIAGLEDAHSRLAPPDSATANEQRLPLSFRVVGDAIYVEAVFDESLDSLLGARVLDVEQTSVTALIDRTMDLRGGENRYFARWWFALCLGSNRWLDHLLEVDSVPREPTLRVRTADRRTLDRSLAPIADDREPVSTLDRTVDRPDGVGPRYSLFDDGDVAVFTPGNLSQYREVLESARNRDADYARQMARKAYRAQFDDEPPDALADIVPRLPSMTETLTALVRSMAAESTEGLVVDLRDNPGGDSRYAEYLGYVLFGLDRFTAERDWTVAYKRRSEAHRERYGVPDSARDECSTFDGNPSDYDFGPVFRERTPSQRRDALVERLSVGTFGAELDDRTHDGYYEPDRIVVATTAGTLSSAFAGVALLSELGADVVGVPPGQAPRSYGEAVEVELSHTGLTADVAGSMYHWTRDPTESVISMSRKLTPELFEERYDRADDAVLELALEHVRDGR